MNEMISKWPTSVCVARKVFADKSIGYAHALEMWVTAHVKCRTHSGSGIFPYSFNI